MGGAVPLFEQSIPSADVAVSLPNSNPAFLGTCQSWFAIRTRPRHEKRVGEELREKGIESFVPTVTETHFWSDRKKRVQVPVFPGYAFVRLALTVQMRVAVLRVNGVLNFVGSENFGTPIPAEQIEYVRKIVESQTPFLPHPFLRVGQKVTVRNGSLAGMAGILTECGRRLVISVDAIAQSLSIVVNGYDIRPA